MCILKKPTKLLAFGLSVLFLFGSLILVTPQNENKGANIVFEGFDGISADSNTSEITEMISQHNDSVTLSIKFNDSYDGETERPGFDATEGEIDNAIYQRRLEISNYYSIANQQRFESLNIEDYSDLFISRYAPWVDVTVSQDAFLADDCKMLYDIAEHNFVDTVYVQTLENNETRDDMASAFPSVGLPTPTNIPSHTYDGTGVVVGVLEAGGIVDLDHENISGSNVTTRREWYFNETETEHALRVVSIVGANTGIAREATILSVQLSGNPKSEVEWMLDNGVNIITNSWSEVDDSKTGNYKSNSAYFDYICRLNWVTVCASAGNSGNSNAWVGNPGLGYNVITVGASDDATDLRPFSSYKENFGISKPTLVAPGYDISVPTLPDTEIENGTTYLINCGTSFSTPIVAGTIALLMDEYPSLKTYPEVVISMLTASASDMSSTYNTYDTSGLEEKVGAGKLDYTSAQQIFGNRVTFTNSSSDIGYKTTKSVYLTAGQTIRISLAWLVDSNDETDTDIVTNYNLHLTNSSGTIVERAESSGNNIEFIEYTVTSTGTYTIGVYQAGAKKGSRTDYGAVTYKIS